MSTSSADVLPTRALRAAVAGLSCCLALAGCTGSSSDGAPPAPSDAASGAAAPAPVPPDLLQAFGGVLERRSAALLGGDLTAFRRDVARAGGFRAAQETYFDNLQQLPLATVSYRVDPASLVRRGDAYWVAVHVTLQLEGYDTAPVESVDRYRFSASRRDDTRFVLSSVEDAAWEERQEVRPQPWDLGPIEVREGTGVLGIFDAGSVGAAGPLLRSVEDGAADVAVRVPYPWDGRVVVYALSDPTFLTTLDDVPGGDPEALDALTFPVATAPGSPTVASTRFLLSPAMVGRDGPERDRLVRHELTHVALGQLDDQAPLWLSEGIAEYVSVQPLAPEDRRVESAALEAAEAGVDDLPADKTFNDADSAVHYGLSWWACEYLALTYGESALWSLVDQLATPGTDPDELLRSFLGLSPRQLARRGARLMITTFDPSFLEPEPTPSPSPTPTPTAPAATPSASPSASASVPPG
ncbi:hypothetical protein [Nocardioides lijunqiniae]|uniref:hypothetical protein n=1 Tax=Nocardioides lijunqiniae TaxID=2760832 RepID=UPI00187825A8|nr:hypothetical protein [Nocardioides lijunqiniae]